MDRNNIKQAQKALHITEQIIDDDNLSNDMIKEYIESDCASAIRLTENLRDLERQEKLLEFTRQFDANKSAKRASVKLRKTKRLKLLRRVTKIAISSAAAIFTIMFLLQIKDNDKSQMVVNFTPQPIIPAEIKVPTLIDNMGNIAELESELLTKNENLSFIKIDIESKKVSYNKENNMADSTTFNELIMPSKFIYTLSLADGTEVVVNAGSKIKYPTQFNDSVRVVELNGEAYFNVAKSDKPFIVKTEGMEIKVYGTRFNVNTYNNKTETVLLSGSIGATIEDEEFMLAPNEMIIYDKDKNIELSTVNAENYIYWINSDFDYRKREMGDVLKDVSRWYGIEINTEVNIDKLNVSLYSSRSRDVLNILKLIEFSADVKFIREGGNTYRLVKEI